MSASVTVTASRRAMSAVVKVRAMTVPQVKAAKKQRRETPKASKAKAEQKNVRPLHGEPPPSA